MVTIREALVRAVELLGEREYMNPILDSQLLLAYTLGADKNYIYTHMNTVVEEDRLAEFYGYVRQRAVGYPLQYILKSQEFMGLEFKVDKGVLVPRPDTEILVERIIEICKDRYSDRDEIRILEIGTGSGAIAISLAHYLENAVVYAVDVDDVPYETAVENAKKNNLENRTIFLKGDLFEPIKKIEEQTFEIIVSNPPYIRTDEIEDLQIEVATHEPKLALDGGVDGLDFYRAISEESINHIASDGVLAYEIGHDQARDVSKLIEADYTDIEIIKDYGGNDRVVIGYRKG